MRFVVVVIVRRRRGRQCDQGKPAGGDAAADTFAQCGLPAVGGYRGGQVRENPRPQIGQGIEHRGGKHVASQPAGRIQVNMMELSHDVQEPELRMGLLE